MYVKPCERVTDFRTFVSGVRAKHLKSGDAVTLRQCQAAVVPLLKVCIQQLFTTVLYTLIVL